jgi:hypothetical protein
MKRKKKARISFKESGPLKSNLIAWETRGLCAEKTQKSGKPPAPLEATGDDEQCVGCAGNLAGASRTH